MIAARAASPPGKDNPVDNPEKRYKLFVKAHDNIVWTYADTYVGARLVWTAMRLARAKGMCAKVVPMGHQSLREYTAQTLHGTKVELI